MVRATVVYITTTHKKDKWIPFSLRKKKAYISPFLLFFFLLSVLSSAAVAVAAAAILSHVARLAKTMLLYIWQYAIALYIQCTFTSQEQP